MLFANKLFGSAAVTMNSSGDTNTALLCPRCPDWMIHPEQPSGVLQPPIRRSNQFNKLNSSGGCDHELFSLFVLAVCITHLIAHFKSACREIVRLASRLSVPLSSHCVWNGESSEDEECSSIKNKTTQCGVFLKLIGIQDIHVCIKAELRPVLFCTFTASLLTIEVMLKVMKLHISPVCLLFPWPPLLSLMSSFQSMRSGTRFSAAVWF